VNPTARQNAKPNENYRYWPHFTQGVFEDTRGYYTLCADCNYPAYLDATPSDPAGAQVAHCDPSVAEWKGNVIVTCRACNTAHGNRRLAVAGLTPSDTAMAQSESYVRSRKGTQRAERERRIAARSIPLT